MREGSALFVFLLLDITGSMSKSRKTKNWLDPSLFPWTPIALYRLPDNIDQSQFKWVAIGCGKVTTPVSGSHLKLWLFVGRPLPLIFVCLYGILGNTPVSERVWNKPLSLGSSNLVFRYIGGGGPKLAFCSLCPQTQKKILQICLLVYRSMLLIGEPRQGELSYIIYYFYT